MARTNLEPSCGFSENQRVKMIDELLATDDYDLVISKFNALSHFQKFLVMGDEDARAYLYRATKYRQGTLTL